MNGTMMRSMDARETEIDLRDAGDGEDDEGQQTWKTLLETVLEEEEEEDVISTQSDTRPLINERDPRQINECLKVSFEDVIAEPVSVRSGDRVWIWSHALYEVSRVWFYRIITALLAVPVSLLAGILFAVLSFVHICSDPPQYPTLLSAFTTAGRDVKICVCVLLKKQSHLHLGCPGVLHAMCAGCLDKHRVVANFMEQCSRHNNSSVLPKSSQVLQWD